MCAHIFIFLHAAVFVWLGLSELVGKESKEWSSWPGDIVSKLLSVESGNRIFTPW